MRRDKLKGLSNTGRFGDFAMALAGGGLTSQTIAGVVGLFLLIGFCACLPVPQNVTPNPSFDANSTNKTVITSNDPGDNSTATSESGDSFFSTEFKVCLGIAVVAAVFVIIAYLVIKSKYENQYAQGGNLPSPTRALSSKF